MQRFGLIEPLGDYEAWMMCSSNFGEQTRNGKTFAPVADIDGSTPEVGCGSYPSRSLTMIGHTWMNVFVCRRYSMYPPDAYIVRCNRQH
jgi:hypothetical protein